MSDRVVFPFLKWVSLAACLVSLYLSVYNLIWDYKHYTECLANVGHFTEWDSSFIRIRYTAWLPLAFLAIACVFHQIQSEPQEMA